MPFYSKNLGYALVLVVIAFLLGYAFAFVNLLPSDLSTPSANNGSNRYEQGYQAGLNFAREWFAKKGYNADLSEVDNVLTVAVSSILNSGFTFEYSAEDLDLFGEGLVTRTVLLPSGVNVVERLEKSEEQYNKELLDYETALASEQVDGAEEVLFDEANQFTLSESDPFNEDALVQQANKLTADEETAQQNVDQDSGGGTELDLPSRFLLSPIALTELNEGDALRLVFSGDLATDDQLTALSVELVERYVEADAEGELTNEEDGEPEVVEAQPAAQFEDEEDYLPVDGPSQLY